MKRFYSILILVFVVSTAFSQTYLPDSLKSKYHMLTYEELENHKNGVRESKSITPTAPPDGFVRNIAEWETNQGVIVAYPKWYQEFGIPVSLIQQMAEITHVYIIYYYESDLPDIQSQLTSGGVNTDNVTYHNIPQNTYWTRDFSPWFIQHGDVPEVGIVNFDYNRDRPDDNNVPVEFGALLDIDVFGMDVVHTGGNYMCDGMGKAASTTLVYDENSISDALVNTRMEDYLGITDYLVVEDPMDDYIYHIDCWGKYLDVDKVLVGEVPESDYRYEDYEAAADYFANHPSSYGNNYEVYRAYSPDGQPYTNSLIMNGHVFVPVPASGAAADWNDEAIAVYQEAMPGYVIHAVENTTAPEWQSTDALHCRTHEVPDVEMLHIYHSAYYGLQEPADNYPVSAEIVSYGGNDLIADSLRVYYRVDEGNWQYVLMSNTSGNAYTANIPSQASGSTVEYIIRASDMTERTESHPFIGFPDPHTFVIDGTSAIETVNSSMSIFPNPTNGKLSVAMHYLNEENAVLEILDVNGRVCRHENLSNTGDYKLLRFDVSDLPSGAYVVKVTSDSQAIIRKFIRR